MKIQSKRIYEEYSKSDGYRVLADRLWPRGVKKQDAHIDLWAKDICPSSDLRKWFHENREAYDIFKKKYIQELESMDVEIKTFLENIEKQKIVTLLSAVKEIDKSHIPILMQFIQKRL